MPHGVVMAIRSGIEADVAAAIDAHPALVVSRRCADLAEAIAAAEAGVGGVVVVSAQPHLNRASVRRIAKAGVPIVGVADGERDAEALAPLGLAQVFDAGDGADAIVAGVAAALAGGELEAEVPSDVEADAPRERGVVIAVWGPAGAPGRTTAAIEIAAFAARAAGAVLVDADTYGASVAQRLGMLDEAPGIAALARSGVAGTLVAADVERHALGVGGGLRVASGLSRPDRWPELSEAALDAVWEGARDASPVTVIDTHSCIEVDGGGRNAAATSALAAADVVVVVGAPDPVGIQRLVAALSDLADSGLAEGAERLVVVNRLRASAAGARPAEAVADALARYASVDRVWTVSDDPKACDEALLAGQSLTERAPGSPATQGFHVLAAAALEAATRLRTVGAS